jgi:hypothetical protein
MVRSLKTALAVAGVVALAACASTTYKSSWSNPEAKSGTLAGKKVVAVVINKNESARRGAEKALADQLTAAGAEGIPAFTILPADQIKDKDAAKAKLTQLGVDGAVIMRVTGKDTELNYTPGMTMSPGYWGSPYYGSMWGGGYWGYGWGAAYSPGYLTEDTIVSVETLVYSLRQDKLVWAGMSETTNPSKVDAFVKELTTGAIKEMKKAGLLVAPAK